MLISNITSNHKTLVQELLTESCRDFIIVSPYLAQEMQTFLDEFDFSSLQRISLVTTFKPKDPEQFTKPFQIYDFMNFFKVRYPNVKMIVHIDNKLHGKLYISRSDQKKMIVTSANFTNNGMNENHEWGVLVEDVKMIENALEDVLNNVEYEEVSFNQIKKACDFARGEMKLNPQWNKKTPIFCNILEKVYSDENANNNDPKYFLKPLGTTENPITLERRRDFSELHQQLHFSKKEPKGVRKGDFVITTAVGKGSDGALLSYFRVTGGIQHVTAEQLKEDQGLKRWPWFVEGKNNSQKFGKLWWQYNLRRQDLLEEFKKINPDVSVTYSGASTLGTLNFGNDKVRVTKEFGEFLINKIKVCEES